MAKILNYPKITDPIRGHFYKNSEGRYFVKTVSGWQRCCWYVLGDPKYAPDYRCPTCQRSLLPKISENEFCKLKLIISDIT